MCASVSVVMWVVSVSVSVLCVGCLVLVFGVRCSASVLVLGVGC